MEGLVRRINSGNYDRDFAPVDASSAPQRRAFLNEVAFEVFCACLSDSRLRIPPRPIDEYISNVIPQVQAIAKLAGWDGDYRQILSQHERDEVQELSSRLLWKANNCYAGENVLSKPRFAGCGIINACVGDILLGKTLLEIKSGERFIRSIDLRQIIVYLSLNNQSKEHYIDYVGILNPRVGISCRMSCDELCFEASGRLSIELLDLVSYGIWGGDVSR
jgi:hypothetical protein